MVEPNKVSRKICGKIFIMANDIFSLICAFCEDEFYALEDFRVHIADHFPDSLSIIKNEDSISCHSYDTAEILEYNLTDDLQGDDASQSSIADLDLSPSILNKEIIQSGLTLNVISNKKDVVADNSESDDENGLQTELHTNVLSKQLQIHIAEKSNKCNECSKSFSRMDQLNIHMLTHSGENPFEENKLTEHLMNHSGEKPFKCNLCSRSFSQKSHLNRHMLTHSGEKAFECNVCSRSFSQNCSLTRHMLTHTGSKPFECNVCRKSFVEKYKLTNHLMNHSGEKPHKCNECCKSFSRMDHLNRHILTHSIEKPHKCNLCSKSFWEKSKLKRHMLTHSGEKAFECNMCSRGFSQKTNLTKHILTHYVE